MAARQYAVLGPLQSGAETRGFLGCEVEDGAPRSDRPVVVVWLPDELGADPRRLTQMLRETAFVTKLEHENVLRPHGMAHFESGWARITDFADGEPLGHLLTRGEEAGDRPDPATAARVVLDLASGLHFAHEAGVASGAGRPIVHGGVRPETVLLGFDGRVRLGGFGAAAFGPTTAHGFDRRRWAAFLAPEQIIGGKGTTSVATDVYALGALLHTLLTGRRPYPEAEDVDAAVMSEPPPRIEEEGVTGALGAVAEKAMAKRGAGRFASAQAFAEAIRAVLDENGVEAARRERLAAWISRLVPPDAPERTGRADLLETASDPDAVTPLTPSASPPGDLDPDLYAAALPAGVSPPARVAPSRAATVLEDRPPGSSEASPDAPRVERSSPLTAGPVPVGMDEAEPTVASGGAPPSPERPGEVTGVHAKPWADAVEAPAPRRSGSPPAGEAPPAAQGPATAPEAQPESADLPAGHWPPPPPGAAYPVPIPVDPRTGQPISAPRSNGPTGPGAAPSSYGPPVYGSAIPGPRSGAHAPLSGHHAPLSGHHAPLSGHHAPLGGPRSGPHAPLGGPRSGFGGAHQPPGGRSFLADAQATQSVDLLENQPVQGLPRSSPKAEGAESESRITAFNQRTGDGSRSLLYIVIVAAFGLLLFVILAPGATPEGLEEPTTNTKLDRALVQEVLAESDRARADEEEAGASDDGDEEAGATGADDEADVDESTAEGPSGAAESASEVAAATAPGQLAVRTDPPVDVFLDDVRLGRAPFTVELEPGRHRLRLTDGATGINAYRSVNVTSGETARLRAAFDTSEVVVDAPKGARIFLNGRFLAEAPMKEPATIYEGRYLLKVTYDGLRWTERFTAEPGRRISFDVHLQEPGE